MKRSMTALLTMAIVVLPAITAVAEDLDCKTLTIEQLEAGWRITNIEGDRAAYPTGVVGHYLWVGAAEDPDLVSVRLADAVPAYEATVCSDGSVTLSARAEEPAVPQPQTAPVDRATTSDPTPILTVRSPELFDGQFGGWPAVS